MNEVRQLVEQTAILAKGLRGAFPYDDCRTILRQVKEENITELKRYKALVPDLDSYFSLVESHAEGIEQIQRWDTGRLAQSQNLLRRSLFQWHTKYRPLEWRINQINTPELYKRIAVSDQIRLLLIEMMDQLLESERQKNIARQDQILLSPA